MTAFIDILMEGVYQWKIRNTLRNIFFSSADISDTLKYSEIMLCIYLKGSTSSHVVKHPFPDCGSPVFSVPPGLLWVFGILGAGVWRKHGNNGPAS